MKKQELTQMQLINYFVKSAASDINMSPAEWRFFTCLLSYADVNKNFEAFPSGDTLSEKTGLSKRSIESFRKSLSAAGWFKIVTGKGWGNSNRYYINAVKVIETYNKSANKPARFKLDDLGKISIEYEQVAVKPTHKRDTSGLNRGKTSPKETDHVPFFEDNDDPEWVPF